MWEQLGGDLVDVGGGPDRAGQVFVVAGQHHDPLDAEIVQLVDDLAPPPPATRSSGSSPARAPVTPSGR